MLLVKKYLKFVFFEKVSKLVIFILRFAPKLMSHFTMAIEVEPSHQ